MINFLIIGLGGFAGAISRYAVGLWVGERWGRTFPLGTLAVNLSGCFLIGFFMTIFLEKYFAGPEWRAFLIVGFLGAYTTFSTFEYETGALIGDSELLWAGLNIVLSVALGFAALKLGDFLARVI